MCQFCEIGKSTKNKAELEDFKALLLMDISILSGCDINWQPYSEPSSSAAPTAEAVLAFANSGDDNSSSDAEAAGPVTNAPSPVFGLNGVEPAAAPPAESAALAPSAQPQQGLPLLRANPDANEDELLEDGTNFFRWEPTRAGPFRPGVKGKLRP